MDTEIKITTKKERSLRDIFNMVLSDVKLCELYDCDELTIRIDNKLYFAFKYDDTNGVSYDICGRKSSIVEVQELTTDEHDNFKYTVVRNMNLDKMYKRGTTITVTEG